ncbi:MAG: sigma-70 family RNA polymerase sigma factor [Myxococcales bacterium]|nr:sigma-70 family RNA polymerase sigma factor [Myxococcales bacterium]
MTAASDRPHPEQALIDRLQAGDQVAYRELYRAYAGEVYRLGRQFVHSDAEAEEVVQEVFVSAFSAIDRFRGHARLKTWLYRITVNRALKRRRWWTRRREVPEEPVSYRLSTGVGPESRAADREALAVVRACLDRLDERKRTVLVLHELEGLDTQQIAEVLQCPRSTVLTRLSRARKAVIQAAEAQGVRLPGEEG